MIFENAHEILKKIKQKEVSAQEVLESFLKQVEAVNPSINALIDGFTASTCFKKDSRTS